jgi:hypothetical protein
MNLLPGDLWTRVEALFLEAVELPACARELFVLENCGGDVRVRDEVLRSWFIATKNRRRLLLRWTRMRRV